MVHEAQKWDAEGKVVTKKGYWCLKAVRRENNGH